MNAKEELQSIAPQHVSEVAHETLLSAIASETRRICAQNTHFMGEWLEGEVPEATSIDAANYKGPGVRQKSQLAPAGRGHKHRRF